MPPPSAPTRETSKKAAERDQTTATVLIERLQYGETGVLQIHPAVGRLRPPHATVTPSQLPFLSAETTL